MLFTRWLSNVGMWKLFLTSSHTSANFWKPWQATCLIPDHPILISTGPQRKDLRWMLSTLSRSSLVDCPLMPIVDCILFRFLGSWLLWARIGECSIWHSCRILTLDCSGSRTLFPNTGWSWLVFQPPRWSRKQSPSYSPPPYYSRWMTVAMSMQIFTMVGVSLVMAFPATSTVCWPIPSG